jgi:hypothetical protein
VRLLGLGGIYLGREGELLGRSGLPANPRGFWEHRDIAHLNHRLLKRLGGSWSEPPPLPAGWELADGLAGEREEARAILERAFDGYGRWGWKDPRNSLTLPFWQNLLPGHRYDVRYVICLRNPLDVIDSLKLPRPQSRQQTGTLWLTYLASALVNTAGRPRILVPYEAYFRDWRGTVERLLGFAGCPPPAAGREVEARMREFTDEGLWRHRTGAEEVVRDTTVPEPARALHLIVELLASSPDLDPPLAAAVDAYAEGLLAAASES